MAGRRAGGYLPIVLYKVRLDRCVHFVFDTATATSTTTSTARNMKMYTLGSMGDRVVSVKKSGGEYVVTIKRKDDETKFIELPAKR